MTEIIQNNRNINSVIKDRRAFLPGLDWKTLPPEEKSARAFAQKNNAEYFISCQYQEAENETQTRTMVAYLSEKSLPAGATSFWSLALIIKPLIEPDGYAIFELGDDRFGFVSCYAHVLVNDVVGDRSQIMSALNTFLEFNEIPDSGWITYQPASWDNRENIPSLSLSALTDVKRPPKEAAFLRVSRKRQFTIYGGGLILAILLWNGISMYQEYREQEAIAESNRLRLARERADKQALKIAPPWQHLPEIQTFIKKCAGKWGGLPLSIAGWRFDLAECSTSGNSGLLRTSYREFSGITVEDFSTRIREIFQGKTTATFVLPEGSAGGFSLPVSFNVSSGAITPEMLPRVTDIQERLTTFAQRMKLKLTWQKKENTLTDDEGRPVILPWNEYELMIQTSIPPSVLFDDTYFHEPAVRFQYAGMKLEAGRLNYEIKGAFYVKNN
ncbi:type 4b pilus protein PilO2 [Salmonella enterica subsp. enterica serovar 4,[5],12:b:-]|nr:type 4b pilus protein PilO2 [Salmonella enterica subsp. enterica serovar 4,[5],12:b:-]